jgi:hypothetical protein
MSEGKVKIKKPKKHTLSMQSLRYETHEQSVEIKPYERLEFHVRLREQVTWTRL